MSKKIDILKEYVEEKKNYFIIMVVLAIILKATGFYNWLGFSIFILCSIIFRLLDFIIEPKWRLIL